MPRPRKPTNVLKFTGAFDKNPKRAEERQREPKSTDPIGAPPPELEGHALTAWNRIVSEAPPGVLTKRDRLVVQAAAVLSGRMIRGEDDAKLLSQLRVFLGELGMTPAAASKVSAPANDDKDASLNAI
jgi:hypothetical protein